MNEPHKAEVIVTHNYGVAAVTIVGPVTVSPNPVKRPGAETVEAPPSPPSSTPGVDAALEQILCSMFTLDEFLRFLRHTEQGTTIVASVPQSSLQGFVSEVIAALRRHGHRGRIDAPFFEDLATARPGRHAEIAEIALSHGVSLTRR